MALVTEISQLRLTIDGQQAINQLTLLEIGSKKLKDEQKDLTRQQKDVEKAFDKTNTTYQKQKEKLLEIGRTQGENSEKYITQKKKVDELNASQAENVQKLEDIKKALSAVNDQIDAENKKMTELRNSEGDLLRTTQSLIFEKRSLSKEMLNSTFGTDKYNEALKRTLEIEKELDDRSKASGRNGGFGRATPQVSNATPDDATSEGMFGTIGAKVAGVIGIAMGAKEVIADIIEVGTEYKKLNILLDSSVEHNQTLFKEGKALIRSFSDDFGIGLGEVTETFVRMNNLGITPTRQSLTQVSDFALANKKTINDYVEAIADAQTGENERLKEFGIKSAKHGDKIIYTYKGISTEVKNNAQAINEYLLGLGSLNSVAGITADLGKSASAQWVKFMNIIKDIAFSVFNFFEPAVSTMIKGLATFATGIADVFDKTGGLTRKYEEQRQVVSNLATSTEPLLKRYDELKSKTNLSKIEQIELNKIISTLATTLPASALQFDKYGNAIGVSTDKAREFIKIQKAMLKAQNADLINKLDTDLKSVEKNLSEQQRLSEGAFAYSEKFKKEMFIRSKSGVFDNAIITEKEFKSQQDKIRILKEQAEELKLAKKGLSGENLENPEIAKPNPLNIPSPKTGPTKAEESAANKKAEEVKKLADELLKNEEKVLAEIKALQISAIHDELEREKVKLVEKNYEEIEAERKKLALKTLSQKTFNAFEIEKNKELQSELSKLDNKQEENALKVSKLVLQTDLDNAKASGDEKEILAKELAINIVDEQIAILTAGEELHSTIHEKYEAERAGISAKFAKKVEENKTKLTEGFEKSRDEYEKLQEKQKEQAKEKLEQTKLNFKNKVAQLAENAIFGFIKEGINKQITEEDTKYQKLVSLNDQQLANKQISQAQHDKNALTLQAKHEGKIIELKKKQAIYDKAKAIMDIAINTAVGVVKAASGIVTAPLIPWIIATGVIEAAAVALQPLPQYFDGGYTKDGGNAPKTNDGKGGFLAINHPNELIVSNADLSTDWGQAIQHIYESRTINNSVVNTTNSTQNQGQVSPDNSDNQMMSQAMNKMITVASNLNETLQNGIIAKTQFTSHDIDNFSKLQQQNAKIKANSLN